MIPPSSGTPAYRIDGAPAPAERFYAVACDPRRSVVVEACAGSGKTWMLVSRILRALLDGAAPHEILAITFTRQAAAEMRERLATWLRDLSVADEPARIHALRERGLDAAAAAALAGPLRELHARLMASPRPVAVETFHGWFWRLLAAAPLALRAAVGLAARAELVEKIDDHYDAVHRRFHIVLHATPALRADLETVVARRGRNATQGWLDAVLARRVEFELADEAGTLEHSVPPVDDPLAGGALDIDALATLARALGGGNVNAQKQAIKLEQALRVAEPGTRFTAIWNALYTQTETPRKLGAIDGLAALQNHVLVIAELRAAHVAGIEHAALVRLGRVLLAEFAAYKRAHGLIDMNDLERAALALLRDAQLSGWVHERLDARVRHLLVDEFQDTSPLQWHAMHAWLAGYAGAGGGASGHKPLSLFIVGDPKQSIYRFRRAEPRVFMAARDFVLTGLDGHVLECDHTRRNARAVLDAVNGVFAPLADGTFTGFRAHTTTSADAGAVRQLPRAPRPQATRDDASAEPVWRDSLNEPRREPDQVLREHEAATVADAVAALIRDDGYAPGDVMVLSRKRGPLRLVADALRERGIVHAASEEQRLTEAPEVRDLVALLDVLVSSRHALSLAHALRSPVFGASDDDLVTLALAAEHGDWWVALVMQEHTSPALQRAQALLPAWREAARRLPPHDLLERIVGEGDVRARYAAVVPASRRAVALDAIDALLAQALLVDGGRRATPYRFVRALRQRPLRYTPPRHADAVQLLTVHGAKGLEARAVFVIDADPPAQRAGHGTALIDWPVAAARPLRFAFLYAESRCPPGLRDLLAAELAAREREELNALYVAMTRARERLVVSATPPPPRDAKPTSWWDRVAPQALAWAPPPAPRAADAGAPIEILELPAFQARAVAATPVPFVDVRASIGRAVHRALEWWAPERAVEPLVAAAADEFGAPPAEVGAVVARILAHPDTAAFYGGAALVWAGNEVSIGSADAAGGVQRIDRLVLLQAGGVRTWWVLDYKLHADPAALAGYRAQLLHYRERVAAAQPSERVRCAFIAGDGRCVEIEGPGGP